MMLAMFEGAQGNDSLESLQGVLADGEERRWAPPLEALHLSLYLQRVVKGFEMIPQLSEREDRMDEKYAANKDFDSKPSS